MHFAGAASVEVQTDELMALRPSMHRRTRSDPELGASLATALREWKARAPLGSEEEQAPLCEKGGPPPAQPEAGMGGWPRPLRV